MSLQWRLTIISTAIIAVLITVVGVLAVSTIREFLLQRVDENLDQHTTAITLRTINMRQEQNLRDVIDNPTIDNVYYTVINTKGEFESDNPQVPINTENVVRGLQGEVVYDTQYMPDGTPIRVMVRPLRWSGSNQIAGVLQAATPISYIDQAAREVAVVLFFVSLLLLVGAAFGSHYLIGRALRAVDRVTMTVHQIEQSQDLSQRLPEVGADDAIGTLVKTFNGLLAKLQRAFESQRRFVADSSHELRTPLTVIKSNLHLLRQTNDPDERNDLLTVTEGEVSRLNRMVDDLLYMAQMQAGHDLKPVLKPVELDSLLLDAFARVRPLARLKKQRLAFAHEDIAATMGDREQLQHLLLNLLDNAVKYTPQGGTISLGLWAESDWARIEVSDTGAGIAPTDLPHIFERFYRTGSARQNQRSGSGLGLSIVKAIAEAHNGYVEVFSEVGQGTTFRLWLPALRSAADLPLLPEVTPEAESTSTPEDGEPVTARASTHTSNED
ncbi:MAG TPA: HAMP domain-containing sensor histidine kinase [Chloroflexia bacterium]|nr:HAMP domain-containing sensor histidine kinase [Chloroflexia bacterium]